MDDVAGPAVVVVGASAAAAGGGAQTSAGVEDDVATPAGVGDGTPTAANRDDVAASAEAGDGRHPIRGGDPSPPSTRPGARPGAARAVSRAGNVATPGGGGRELGRESMLDCAVFDAAASDLGGSPERDRRPPAAGAAMREARAAAASAAAAVEAADGVGEDDTNARAIGSAARAWRGEGVQLREDAESSLDLVSAAKMAAGGRRSMRRRQSRPRGRASHIPNRRPKFSCW
ncbi:histone-lysine N-methyltransferase, H3 lysine-9 specific SUVH3 [Triticum aestivum]|uniref:histone-lysine N-methyltransferase, H3 lysine-9 specific SUVH3 n=1 Tax=Triticum aestivum TaxID=4565 RepID=UPI001D005752|nr:histone-lysine N-methyltransferase, H3 lysine-9 specific SUVH3-like [Triticum aestivum]